MTSTPLGRAAFTLVELLVTMTVLAGLGLLIVQIIGASEESIRTSSRMVDTARQARFAMERLKIDLTTSLRRGDMDFMIANPEPASADDRLRFLAAVPSGGQPTGGNRGVSVVAYRVAPHPDNGGLPCLLRAGLPLGWDHTGFVGRTSDGVPIRIGGPNFPVAVTPSHGGVSSDYDVLAPGVFRLVVGFHLRPDNQPITLLDGTTIANARGQLVYSPPVRRDAAGFVDPSRIGSLVIGLAVLDSDSLGNLTPAQIETLAAAFPTPQSNVTPNAAWSAIAGAANSLPASIPLPARQGLRVYQTAIPLEAF